MLFYGLTLAKFFKEQVTDLSNNINVVGGYNKKIIKNKSKKNKNTFKKNKHKSKKIKSKNYLL